MFPLSPKPLIGQSKINSTQSTTSPMFPSQQRPQCSPQTKKINATKFMEELKNTLQNYQKLLNANDIQSEIWNNCIERVKFLIDRT